MTNDKVNFSINKLYLILFFYNSFTTVALFILFFNFKKMLAQIELIEQANKTLIAQNADLQKIIQELQTVVINNQILKDFVVSQPVPMPDDYLINICIIFILCCLGGISIWYFYYLVKFGFYSFISVTSIFSPLFYSEQLKSFELRDKFDNHFFITFSDNMKSADILIKPANSEVICSLEEYFAAHPELLNNAADTVNTMLASPDVRTGAEIAQKFLFLFDNC